MTWWHACEHKGLVAMLDRSDRLASDSPETRSFAKAWNVTEMYVQCPEVWGPTRARAPGFRPGGPWLLSGV